MIMNSRASVLKSAVGLLAVCIFPLLPCHADESGFVSLFNRKDLTGWQTTGNWVVEEGVDITLKPRPGESGWTRYKDYLTTSRTYRDFVLDLEFKFNAKGNSGVFLRVGDLKDHVNSGMEVQILDTHGKENVGHHDCGGLIKTQGPSKNMVKPAGEWNRYTITLKGNQLTVVLNGQTVIKNAQLPGVPEKGKLGLQHHGGKNAKTGELSAASSLIQFRNVSIKEL